MKSPSDISRREFFKISLAGAGLAIGFGFSGCTQQDALRYKANIFSPSIYLKITADNQVTIVVAEAEMGQGVWTSLPMLVAEELEIDWDAVRIEQAPLLPELRNNITWGSSSVRNAWVHLRQAGAIARQMLINAAAESWQVPANECIASSGRITHNVSGRTVSYGDLANAAAALPIPEEVALKKSSEFKYIGTAVPMLDAPAKCTGSAVFGIDVKLDGMLIATVTHCPVFGGTLKKMDASAALEIPGVRQVLRIDSGVAVVADHFWAAKKGCEALRLEWDFGPYAELSSEAISDSYALAIQADAEVIQQRGNAAAVPAAHSRVLQASYEVAYQAHATMEPMCCTAHVRDGLCDIWAPTQAPGLVQRTAAHYLLSKPQRLLEKIKHRLTGESLDMIRVHTTFLGGAFGRRYEQDFIAESVQIAQAVAHPVKLIWTREEDMQHDFYRPFTRHQLRATVDIESRLVHWAHRIAGQGQHLSTGGADLPYATDNYLLEYVQTDYAVPVGYWRSVGSSHNAFVMESFIDELATAMNDDPYMFRRRLLADTPRLQAVLDLVAEKAGWGEAVAEGRFRGIALSSSNGSYVAQVAEISVGKAVKVHRVVCAIDCGQVVNPDTVRAQMEGSIVFGLTACIKGAITIEQGRVQQSNFHDFPILGMDEMPKVETHIIASTESPGGVGEPGVPPIAPAIANALYAATGVRVRKLPITQLELAGRG